MQIPSLPRHLRQPLMTLGVRLTTLILFGGGLLSGMYLKEKEKVTAPTNVPVNVDLSVKVPDVKIHQQEITVAPPKVTVETPKITVQQPEVQVNPAKITVNQPPVVVNPTPVKTVPTQDEVKDMFDPKYGSKLPEPKP